QRLGQHRPGHEPLPGRDLLSGGDLLGGGLGAGRPGRVDPQGVQVFQAQGHAHSSNRCRVRPSSGRDTPPMGHGAASTAAAAGRAPRAVRAGCAAPPGTATAHRSSPAGPRVPGPGGIAAPASPASRPAQAGPPVTGTDGIQSGEVSDPSEVIRATTGNDGAVSGQSVPPSVATMTSSGSLSNSSGTAARPNRISVPPPPEAECNTPVSDRARARYTAASTSRTNTRSSWTPQRWAISVISRPTSPSSVSDIDPEVSRMATIVGSGRKVPGRMILRPRDPSGIR